MIASFIIASVTTPDGETPPSAFDFTRYQGPLIVVATILVPALVAALFSYWRSAGTHVVTDTLPPRTGSARAADHAYHALITPLAELIRRLGWGVIIVLLLILSYRITDSVWGSFANPFYLKELQYSGDEVAFASKIFGVLMTMAGIALGAFSPSAMVSARTMKSPITQIDHPHATATTPSPIARHFGSIAPGLR